jgi:hypothetical protein
MVDDQIQRECATRPRDEHTTCVCDANEFTVPAQGGLSTHISINIWKIGMIQSANLLSIELAIDLHRRIMSVGPLSVSN